MRSSPEAKKETNKMTTNRKGSKVGLIILLLLFSLNTSLSADIKMDALEKKLNQTVSLFFNNENIHMALTAIGNVYDINMTLENDIDGDVTVNLVDVTLIEAVEAILDLNDLTWERKGNIISIEKKTKVAETQIIRLQNAKAEDLVEIINGILSEEGTVQIYGAANELIIKDTAENILKVKKLVSEIDLTPKEVTTTQIIRLEHAKAEDLEEIVKGVLSDAGSVQLYSVSNEMIITDLEENILKVRQLITDIDVMPEETSETQIIRLNHATAEEIKEIIQGILSADGTVQTYGAANELIIKDTAENILKVQELVAEIDIRPQQVMIESKLIDIKYEDLTNLGVTWKADYSYEGLLHGIIDESNSKTETATVGSAMAGPSTGLSGNQFDMTFALAHGSVDIDIDALIRNNKAKVLASPTIVTLNNREAKINIGEKVPTKEKTQTTTGTTEQTVYQDVGIKLNVIPQITHDGYINMKIHPEVSSVTEILDDGPRITTREADTQVVVRDGETIIIAGLIHGR